MGVSKNWGVVPVLGSILQRFPLKVIGPVPSSCPTVGEVLGPGAGPPSAAVVVVVPWRACDKFCYMDPI